VRILSRLVLPLAFIFGCVLLVLALSGDAWGHFVPGRHNAVHAIQQSWCGKANVECYEGNRAVRVAQCEASDLWWWTRNKPTQARNGQYRGMFQMGSSERRTYGHGPDPWSQARAAHYYWSITGRDWSPWDPACRP
jgi:hypothetical protein